MNKLRYNVSSSGTLSLHAVLSDGTNYQIGEIGPLSALVGSAALSCWMLNMVERCKTLDLLDVEEEMPRESVASYFFNEDGSMKHLRVQRVNGKCVWVCSALVNKTHRQTSGRHGHGPLREAAYYADLIATVYGVTDEGTKFLLRHGADSLARQIMNNMI